MADMRESTVEDYLIAEVKKLGGEVRKVQWIGRRRAPDRLVLLPGCASFVELKRPGKDATDEQAREHDKMRRAGLSVWVLTSKGEVDEFIQHRRRYIE